MADKMIFLSKSRRENKGTKGKESEYLSSDQFRMFIQLSSYIDHVYHQTPP
jgi:hypothetical protein